MERKAAVTKDDNQRYKIYIVPLIKRYAIYILFSSFWCNGSLRLSADFPNDNRRMVLIAGFSGRQLESGRSLVLGKPYCRLLSAAGIVCYLLSMCQLQFPSAMALEVQEGAAALFPNTY